MTSGVITSGGIGATTVADVIHGMGGDDAIDGRGGFDTIVGGNDSARGGVGQDYRHGEGGNDSLDGGLGDDVPNHGAGNDLLWGRDGDDRCNGGGGADTIIGGAGADKIKAGAGQDVLRYDLPTRGMDRVGKLVSGSDPLAFGAAGFGSGLIGGAPLAAGQLAVQASNTASAPAGSGQFVFTPATSTLLRDADGADGLAGTKIAVLTGGVSLTTADVQMVA